MKMTVINYLLSGVYLLRLRLRQLFLWLAKKLDPKKIKEEIHVDLND